MGQIIIVEGRHDYNKIKEIIPEANVWITNGSAVDSDLLDRLETLSKDNELIIFTDADNSGERIRRIISTRIKNAQHAFIDKDKSLSRNGKKVGIEHASKDTILEALKDIKPILFETDITIELLYDLHLIGGKEAQKRRLMVLTSLGIGYCNGKGLLNRLSLFGITKDVLLEVLK